MTRIEGMDCHELPHASTAELVHFVEAEGLEAPPAAPLDPPSSLGNCTAPSQVPKPGEDDLSPVERMRYYSGRMETLRAVR